MAGVILLTPVVTTPPLEVKFCVNDTWLRPSRGSEPVCGSATYGNAEVKETSLLLTPSPRPSTAPGWPGTRTPSSACSATSMTSSPRRRPFGKPATSPPTTPSRFGFAAGGTLTFSRRYSAGAGFGLTALSESELRSAAGEPLVKEPVPDWVPSALALEKPVRNVATRSGRFSKPIVLFGFGTP
jgi:hypothetical protein